MLIVAAAQPVQRRSAQLHKSDIRTILGNTTKAIFWSTAGSLSSDDISTCSIKGYIPFDKVRGWVSLCTKWHSDSCCRPRDNGEGSGIEGFKLIDTMDLSVVPSTLEERFAALSYVWGSESQVLQGEWPQTIKDATTVANGMGLKYLWVDRYCIDQGNAHEKHAQISNMDSIYNSAEITIVAASGVDAHYGLPGVSRLRKLRPSHKLGNVKLTTLPPDIHISIRQSKWSTRGWTLQEGVLTRRRLIFTDDEMYCTLNETLVQYPRVSRLVLLIFREQIRSRCFDQVYSGVTLLVPGSVHSGMLLLRKLLLQDFSSIAPSTVFDS